MHYIWPKTEKLERGGGCGGDHETIINACLISVMNQFMS